MTASVAGPALRGGRRSSRRGQWGLRGWRGWSADGGDVLSLDGRRMRVSSSATVPCRGAKIKISRGFLGPARSDLPRLTALRPLPHNPALPTASKSSPGDLYCVERGGVSRAAKGADCKSAGLRLRRFESYLPHHLEIIIENVSLAGSFPALSMSRMLHNFPQCFQ